MARPAVVRTSAVTGLLFSSTPCQRYLILVCRWMTLECRACRSRPFTVELAFARQAFAQDRTDNTGQARCPRRHDDRLTVRRMQDIVGRHHQHACFELASSESGTARPSGRVEVALNAAHTSGCSWIALPSISTGSTPGMPGRCSVRRAVQEHGMLADHFSKNIPDLGRSFRQASSPVSPWWTDLGVEPRIDERLNNSIAIFSAGRTDDSRSSDRPRSRNGRIRRACRAGWRTCPACPSACRPATFSDACLAPVMTRPRRPLSNNASTASCSMRFRLRMMMSARATPSAASSDCCG